LPVPIFEYSCSNCRNKIEKITLKPVRDTTVPQTIIEPCKGKCAGAKTRHIRQVSAPAYVGLTPPATSKRATRMAEMRQAKDPQWKQRVKKGLNPEGKRLTNLRKEHREEWKQMADSAFPDHKEKKKEVKKAAAMGEFKTISEGLAKQF
jgi:predicted nucleic acid-binding Zn ribbon protein